MKTNSAPQTKGKRFNVPLTGRATAALKEVTLGLGRSQGGRPLVFDGGFTILSHSP